VTRARLWHVIPWLMPQLRGTFPELTGLRGIAALLVLFYHLRTPQNYELTFGPLDAFSKFGFLGVDMFFVLSGFILSHVYYGMFAKGFNRNELFEFGVARFARIYPLHFVTLFMMLGAYAIAQRTGVHPTEARGYSWEGVVLSLLLLQQWFGAIAPNPSSWSISVELANYLIFPLFLLLPRLPRFAAPLGLVAGAIIVENFSGNLMLRGVTEFAMGCVSYSIATRYDYKSVAPIGALTFACPFMVAQFIGGEAAGITALCFATAMLLITAIERDMFRRICSTGPLVFIGNISYSVYLLQWFVWIGWKHGAPILTPYFSEHPYALSACAAASIIIVSTASFYVFERPTRALLRRALATPAKYVRPI